MKSAHYPKKYGSSQQITISKSDKETTNEINEHSLMKDVNGVAAIVTP
jgi:hypothetical protein